MKILKYLVAIVGVCIFLFFQNQEKDVIKIDEAQKSEQDSAPKERSEYFKLRRGGEIDLKKINHAKKIVGKQIQTLKQGSRDGQINGWQSLGPGNIGGRVRALAVHPTNPSIIFAGAAAGGVWKTTNTGASWSIANPTIDSYPVMDIIFHPTDHDIIFAVTGEFRGGGPEYPGVGVLRSLNGGSSWSIMNQPSTGDFTYLSKIRFNPDNPNIMYASGSRDIPGFGSTAIVYKSTNGGVDWQDLWTETLASSTNVFDMEITDNSSWEIIIGTGDRAYYSPGGGGTFIVIDLDNEQTLNNDYLLQRHEVQSCKSNPETVYVQRYLIKDSIVSGITEIVYKTELWKTTMSFTDFYLETSTSNFDGGDILGSQGDYCNVLWVNPINCDQVLMGGLEMYRYEAGDSAPTQISDGDDDIGANNWESKHNSIHVDQHVIVESSNFDNVTNSTLYIGNDGGVYRTSDVNEAKLDPTGDTTINTTWYSLVSSFEITQFYGGDISYDGNTAVGGSQDNHYIFDTCVSDQTQTWSAFSRGDGGFCKIDKTDNDIFYTTTQNGKLYKTVDGGVSFCNTLRLDTFPQKECCNGCSDFINIPDNSLFIAPLEMSPSNNDHLYIAGTELYKSDGPGINWNQITNISSNLQISAIGVAETTEDTMWIGLETGILYNTVNGGSSWNLVDETSNPELIFNCSNNSGNNGTCTSDIAIHPNNTDLVAITYGGYHQSHIYITEDGGQNWVVKPLGFDMQVNTITWMPDLENVLYVGTDIGVFASNDKGDSWSVVPYIPNGEGPVYVSAMELFWQGDGSDVTPYKLCVATFGRGMWRTSNFISKNLYVDKNCTSCGSGTLASPYKFFAEAVENCLPEGEITFLSSGEHDEIASNILIDKKISIIHTEPIIIK